jgi:capsid protein
VINVLGLISRYLGIGTNAFSDTILDSIDRSNVRFILPLDSALYLTATTRRMINEKIEWVWQNFGIVKEGVGGIARHTVGRGISLECNSTDDEWNQLAEDDFEQYATTPDRCDLSARRTFYEAQTAAVEQRVLRGEFLCGLGNNEKWGGEPAFQIFDSEEISTPPPAGSIGDKIILDGVELDLNSRPVAYHHRNLDGMTWTPIPASQMIHWYKPHAVNQVRGISDLAQAVNPLVDIYELTRLATRSAKAQQLIALVLKNVPKSRGRGAVGGLQRATPGGKESDRDGARPTDYSQLEKLTTASGGGIAYLNGDGEAQLLSTNSPSPLVEAFITNIFMRNVFASLGLPASFSWDPEKLGGANMRFILSKADLLFQVLGDGCIYRFCNPVAFRYLDYRIKMGMLRPCKDKGWASKLSWQTPPRVTVDNGHETRLLIELLANGMLTLREYCNARGLNYRNVMLQWIREPIEFIRTAKQEIANCKDLSPEEGAALLALWLKNMPMWRSSKPGQGTLPGAGESFGGGGGGGEGGGGGQ